MARDKTGGGVGVGHAGLIADACAGHLNCCDVAQTRTNICGEGGWGGERMDVWHV